MAEAAEAVVQQLQEMKNEANQLGMKINELVQVSITLLLLAILLLLPSGHSRLCSLHYQLLTILLVPFILRLSHHNAIRLTLTFSTIFLFSVLATIILPKVWTCLGDLFNDSIPSLFLRHVVTSKALSPRMPLPQPTSFV